MIEGVFLYIGVCTVFYSILCIIYKLVNDTVDLIKTFKKGNTNESQSDKKEQ